MSSWADPWSSGHCDSRPIIQAWFWEQAHDHENRPMPQTWLYGNWWALIFRTKTLTSYFSSWTVMFDMILPFQQQEVEWWHPEWPFEDSRWRCVVVIVAEWLLFPHWASTVLNTSDTLWSCWDCDLSDEMVWECNLKRQKQQTPVFLFFCFLMLYSEKMGQLKPTLWTAVVLLGLWFISWHGFEKQLKTSETANTRQ